VISNRLASVVMLTALSTAASSFLARWDKWLACAVKYTLKQPQQRHKECLLMNVGSAANVGSCVHVDFAEGRGAEATMLLACLVWN